MSTSHKKILILSLSCNIPHFQALLGAVKDTWAKPLVQNKYPNVNWFAFTSCDEKHPNPMVDFEEHVIYVKNDDCLGRTYSKQRDAYNMIKDCVDFDYVIRTNTSQYINVDNLIKYVDSINYYSVLSHYSKFIHEGIDYGWWRANGFFIGCDRWIFDYCMMVDDDYIKDVNGNVIKADDDSIISKRISELETMYDLHFGYVNDMEKAYMHMYNKHMQLNEEALDAYKNSSYIMTDDPNVVNEAVMVRIRSPYDLGKRELLGHELLHMYELDDAKK